MKKSTELFLAHFLYPLLVIAVLAIGNMIISRINTGDFLTYFSKLRLYHWLLLSFAVFLVFIIGKLTDTSKRNPALSMPSMGPIKSGRPTYRELGEHLYEGVLWPISQRTDLPANVVPSPEDYRVEVPPRCPTCKTDLDQRKIFGGRIVWSCPRGDFQIVKSSNYNVFQETVQKLVRGELRK